MDKDKIIDDDELYNWPCQALYGGRGAAIYDNVDGMCQHPECHPRNDDSEGEMKMYYHKYVKSQGQQIFCKRGDTHYYIASMRWTDGLNPEVEKAVEEDARRIAACLNFCKGIQTIDLEIARKREPTDK